MLLMITLPAAIGSSDGILEEPQEGQHTTIVANQDVVRELRSLIENIKENKIEIVQLNEELVAIKEELSTIKIEARFDVILETIRWLLGPFTGLIVGIYFKPIITNIARKLGIRRQEDD
ncbi:MAG: hypothetical protein OXP69_17575 [Spirochaetaceae bacterium]|nr:hypothetical protein [Spirochaetaceae bacterium]